MFFQEKLSIELRKIIMHPYSGCRENPFHFELCPPVTSTRKVELPWELWSCAQVKCFFSHSCLRPCTRWLTHRIPALEMQTQCWSHLSLYLFIFFSTIRVHSFHRGRIIGLEVHCFVFYCNVWTLFNTGFNIAGFATFCYLCSVNSNNSHSCLIYQL